MGGLAAYRDHVLCYMPPFRAAESGITMNLWVGTSGYSYKEWKGSFYPESIAQADMLRFIPGMSATAHVGRLAHVRNSPSLKRHPPVHRRFRGHPRWTRRATHVTPRGCLPCLQSEQ